MIKLQFLDRRFRDLADSFPMWISYLGENATLEVGARCRRSEQELADVLYDAAEALRIDRRFWLIR